MKSNRQKILPFTEVYPSVESLQARHHHRSQVIYLSTILCLLGFIGATPLIEVDIQRQSRGIIRSVQENNQINAPLYGLVSEVRLQNGQEIQKGDLLLRLDTRSIDQKIEQYQDQIEQNETYIRDLDKLLHNTNSRALELETTLYRGASFQFEKQRRQYTLQLEQAERTWQRADQLYKSGAIARAEWEEQQYQRDFQQSQLEQFREQQLQAWNIAHKDYIQQNAEGQHQIDQLKAEKRQYNIYAPVTGTIQQYIGVQAGNYVSPGQTLAQITTHDSLLVEVYVSPDKIGLLSPGMPVRFQIDAFNYNQWGLVEGRISQIDQDISLMEGKPQFLVRCQLSQKSLFLKNGYEGKLKKGMTLSARFQVTRRSLYQLLYDKVDNWVNPQLNQIN